ncbi:hypothetical protein SLS62_000287 [Diatrype stigma]|uniref:RTA1-like protein n=1 Tax=Diatrype stigma TaxID=117547 RepID=A0AAN9YXC0_9PEZI
MGDVLSFCTQGGGGGLMSTAKKQDDLKKGELVIVGGLAIQVIFFSFFVVVTMIFHRRIAAQPTRKSLSLITPWRSLIYVLYVSSALVLIRSIYRIVEYIAGSDGPLLSNEYYLYIFDSLLMAIVTAVFNYFHPSRVIKRTKDLNTVASLEVIGEGYSLPETPPRPYDPLRSNGGDDYK